MGAAANIDLFATYYKDSYNFWECGPDVDLERRGFSLDGEVKPPLGPDGKPDPSAYSTDKDNY